MNERFYHFTRGLLTGFYALFHPQRVDGLENIPAEGGFVLCCNHCSNRDPFYLAVPIKNRHVYFMGKIELFRWKPMARLLSSLGGFPVDRGNSDLGAVRTSLRILANNHGLAIFPQGTRVKDNHRTPMLEGVSMIALRAGKPVIPAYIGGPYRLLRPTQVSYGKPVELSDLGRRVDSDTLRIATQRIEDAVWALKKP